MRRGVDRPDHAQRGAAPLELPAHEQADGDDTTVAFDHPSERRPERVAFVLPLEQLAVPSVVVASRATRRAARGSVPGRRPSPDARPAPGGVDAPRPAVGRARAGTPANCSYRAVSVCIARRTSKRVAAERAAADSSDRRQVSTTTASRASARATGSRGGTSTASVGPNCSAMPPTAVATIGRPRAAASIAATGRPSQADASTKTSQAAMTARASGRKPASTTWSRESELVTEGRDLALQRSLADGDQAVRNASIDESPGRAEQRRVVLLGAEVGDGADHDLVGSQPEPGPDGYTLAIRPGGGAVDVDAVDEHLGSLGGRPRMLARVCSVTANVAASSAAREAVGPPGRRPKRRPRVVLRRHQRRARRAEKGRRRQPRGNGRNRRVAVDDVEPPPISWRRRSGH